MTDNLLRQVSEKQEHEKNKYQVFNFTRNPFPSRPSVTPGSSDKRENGSIYVPELHQEAETSFQKLLVPTGGDSQTRSIAFLLDHATRRGRGIGKTAFLRYQQRRIMKDLGNQLSNGTEVIFAVYLLPFPDGKTRKFWQFHKLITNALIEQEVIATAMWRLRAFSSVLSPEILSQVGNEPRLTLGDDTWLRKNGIYVDYDFMGKKGLNEQVSRNLEKGGVDADLAKKLAHFGHDIHKFEEQISQISDYAWSKNNGKLFFDDLIKVLKMAGFTKGLILVDEVEKIIAPQNSAERRMFTDSLRYFFMDGYSENARLSFCNLLLTIHPYIQELLSPHWNAAGLDRFSALSGELASEYTIYFGPLNQEHAIPLAQEYLDEARTENSYKGMLEPFTPEAINEALLLSGRVPGIFLTLLNNTVEKAIYGNRSTIDASLIKQVAKIREPQEPNEKDQTEQLIEPQVNLEIDE